MGRKLNSVICIFLIFSVSLMMAINVVYAPAEDFDTYTISGQVVTNGSMLNATLNRNADDYAYYDYGVDSFDDFSHNFTTLLNGSDGGTSRSGNLWFLANTVNDEKGIRDAVGQTFISTDLLTTDSGLNWSLRLKYWDDTSLSQDNWYDFEADTLYYLTVNRTGTSVECRIYSDESRTTLLETLAVTDGDENYRYIYGCNSYNSGTARYIQIMVSDLWTGAGDTINPLYRNAGQGNSGILQGSTNELYAEGYDETALDWAWLATNETGSWQNYTYGEHYPHQLDYQVGINDVFPNTTRPHIQGVACDDTFLYASSDDTIKKTYLYAVDFDNPLAQANNANDSGTPIYQINSICLQGSYVYAGARDEVGSTAMIKVFNQSNLAYITEYNLGSGKCEGASWHDNSFWVVYHDVNNITRYNSTFGFEAEYHLNDTQNQGSCWDGDDYLYVTCLATGTYLIDLYRWNGSGFDWMRDYDMGRYQGICKEPAYDTVWVGEGSGPPYYYQGVANLTMNFTQRTAHDSPIDLEDVGLSWVWSNFTWSNSSLNGVNVGWRIYYNDTSGNENVTGISVFRVLITLSEFFYQNFQYYSNLVKRSSLELLRYNSFQVYDSSSMGREAGRLLFSNVLFPGSVNRGFDLSRFFFDKVSVFADMIHTVEGAVLDLFFALFSNFQVFSSETRELGLARTLFSGPQLFSGMVRGLELSRVFSETIQIFPRMYRIIETISQNLFFSLFGNVGIYESLTGLRELRFTLFNNVVVFSDLISLFELSTLDLYFTLSETTQFFASLGRGKELNFLFFDEVNIWQAITRSFEGVDLNIFISLFENVNTYAVLVSTVVAPYVLNDALLLACFAIILAFGAIGLIFLTKRE